MLTINIIGAGKLGQVLGRLWTQTTNYSISAVLNQTLLSSQAAVDFIGQGQTVSSFAELPPADLSLIAVPDEKIASITQQFYQAYDCPKHHLVFHCAGALEAEILKHPRRTDILYAAAHPIYSFHPTTASSRQFAGSLCGIEASPAAKLILEPLFTSIGAKTFTLKPNKALYHAGCVFASNYLLSLADQAMACFQAVDMTQTESHACVYQLMQQTLDNLKHHTHPLEALTGPIQRGDQSTIQKHVLALPTITQQQLYQAHGLALSQGLQQAGQAQEELIQFFQECLN